MTVISPENVEKATDVIMEKLIKQLSTDISIPVQRRKRSKFPSQRSRNDGIYKTGCIYGVKYLLCMQGFNI